MEKKLNKFGDAIEALKKGKIVYRQFWQGTKLYFVKGNEDLLPSIGVNLWNGKKVVGWVSTTEDLLAEDWIIED